MQPSLEVKCSSNANLKRFEKDLESNKNKNGCCNQAAFIKHLEI